jgi:hypothetical protein
MNKKLLDKPAASAKNIAVTRQLTAAILLEIRDRRLMVNKDHFVLIVHIFSHL